MVCRFVGSCMAPYGEINMQVAKGDCLCCSGGMCAGLVAPSSTFWKPVNMPSPQICHLADQSKSRG